MNQLIIILQTTLLNTHTKAWRYYHWNCRRSRTHGVPAGTIELLRKEHYQIWKRFTRKLKLQRAELNWQHLSLKDRKSDKVPRVLKLTFPQEPDAGLVGKTFNWFIGVPYRILSPGSLSFEAINTFPGNLQWYLACTHSVKYLLVKLFASKINTTINEDRYRCVSSGRYFDKIVRPDEESCRLTSGPPMLHYWAKRCPVLEKISFQRKQGA